VEISNEPAFSTLGVTAERDGWDEFIVAVGDIHTAESFPDSLRHERQCRFQADAVATYRTDMSGERTLDRLHEAAHPVAAAAPTAAVFVLQPDRVGLCLPLSALSLGRVMLGAALPAALLRGSEPLGDGAHSSSFGAMTDPTRSEGAR
jgi:hypothetical protein